MRIHEFEKHERLEHQSQTVLNGVIFFFAWKIKCILANFLLRRVFYYLEILISIILILKLFG